jgi:hypothetical protein
LGQRISTESTTSQGCGKEEEKQKGKGEMSKGKIDIETDSEQKGTLNIADLVAEHCVCAQEVLCFSM